MISSIVVAIIVFGIIVLVHEWGHFYAAKKSGVFVEEFAIGMGPKLLSTTRNDTVYSIRLFPIGGFCKMLGEDEQNEDVGAFNNKSVGARIAVVVAGAFMNFVLAFFIILILVSVNGFIVPVIDSLIEDMPAASAGLMPGDTILEINNKKIRIYQDLQFVMSENNGEAVNLLVKRDNYTFNVNIIPKADPETGVYLIGFQRAEKLGLFQKQSAQKLKASISDTLANTFWTMIFYIKSTVVGFTRMLTFKVAPEDIAGPIGIVKIIGESYQSGLKFNIIAAIENVASLAAYLSANLGAINLLPLPALDGGRLVFLIIEGIRRKPINPEKEGMVHFAGFVLLMLLMVFTAYNDIIKLF